MNELLNEITAEVSQAEARLVELELAARSEEALPCYRPLVMISYEETKND